MQSAHCYTPELQCLFSDIVLTLALLPIVSVPRRFVLTDVSFVSFQNSPERLYFLLFLAGFLFGDKRIHVGIVVTCWLLAILVTAGFWFEPGAVVNNRN